MPAEPSSSNPFYQAGLKLRGRYLSYDDVRTCALKENYQAFLAGAIYPGTNFLYVFGKMTADRVKLMLSNLGHGSVVKDLSNIKSSLFSIEFENGARDELSVAWHVAASTPNCVVSRRNNEFRLTYNPGRPEESHWSCRNYAHCVATIAREGVVPEAEVEDVIFSIYGSGLKEGRWIL